jgi:hypothetical protein
MPKPEKINHEDHLRSVIADEAQKTRAAKGNTVIASPTADVASLKTTVDQLRAALTAAGITK